MTEEIKKRIEAVRRGEVPEGYNVKWGCMPNSWEYVPMRKLFSKGKKKNIDNEITTVLTNSAAYGVILQRDYFDKDIANTENTDGYFVVQPNDYIYNPRISEMAPYGPFNKNETGMIGIVSPLYTVLTPKSSKVNSKYLQYFFMSSQWHKFAYSVANYGARFDRMNITDDDFFSLPIVTPPLPEQQKIADILATCDKVIELKRDKIAELQEMKQTFMRKMFPQNGSSVPELRFPGFTGAWEQRKLGEVFSGLQNNTLSKDELSSEQGVALNVHYGDVLVKFGVYLDAKKESIPFVVDRAIVAKFKQSYLRNGDVIFADTAEDETVGKCCEIAGLTDEVVISGLHTIPYRPLIKFASGFLGYYLNSDSYRRQLLPLMQGIKVTSISKSAMQNTNIHFPKEEAEQAKISAYFRLLDNLITLHQREAEEYTRLKIAMMQLLLTGLVRVKI